MLFVNIQVLLSTFPECFYLYVCFAIKSKKLKNFFFLFLFVCSQIQSQEPSHYILGKDIFDGVELYSILQDNDDKIWVTSNNGLYSFNSKDFEQILPENSKSNSLFGLTKDNFGTIYCYNLYGQIFKLSRKTLTLFFEIPEQYLGDNTSIVFDNKNNLLISTNHQLLVVKNNKITDIKKEGAIYTTKKNDTVFYGRDLASKPVIFGFKNNQETKKYSYSVNDHFLATHSKLKFYNDTLYGYNKSKKVFFYFDEKQLKPIDFSFLKKGNHIIFFEDEHLWFSDSENGVYLVSSKEIFNKKKPNKIFKDYFISGVTTDNEGNTWLLTFNNGIIIIPNLKVKNYFTNKNIKGVTKANNSIFFSSNDSIYKLKEDKSELFFITENDRLESFNILKNSNIITTNNGLYLNKNLVLKMGYNRASIVSEDLIFLGFHSGLHTYNVKTKEVKKLTENRVYDICYVESKKEVWFSSSNGLYCIKNEKIQPILYQNKPILAKKIIFIDDKIWTLTNKGIFILDDKNVVEHITENNGLLNNNVEQIKYENNFIYLSFKKAIQRYNLEQKTFENFTFSDGITKRIIDFEVANNTIYAVNNDGLLLFNFYRNKDAIKTYKTIITEAIANGSTTITQNTNLPANEHNVFFSFLTTTYKYDVSYQYQLVGFDEKPIIAKENQSSINYTNLPAGNYTFKVQSFINNKENEIASLSFSIAQFWYKTIAFKILAFIIIASFLMLLYKNRIKKIGQERYQEQMKKQLAESTLTSLKAQMNPHFLFNAMNSIQSLIIENQKDEAYKYLTQLSNFMRENLKLSDVSYVPVLDEIQFVEKYIQLEKLRFEDDFNYEIENNIENTEVLIPSMIIQPFVENAIKHGLLHKEKNKKLNIIYSQSKENIICSVIDNGIGRKASAKINENKKHKSFSTKAIKKRFSILKEYYKLNIHFSYEDLIKDEKPVGTKVTITIPFTNEFES